MKLVLIVIISMGIVSPCFAKAYYASKEEMIQKADCIVIAEVTRIEDANRKGKAWAYTQKATATVERTLKGDAKGEIEIYGQETFICAQCRYEKGRFILFLRKEAGFWVGSNWHLGIRPIVADRVAWFKDGTTRFEMKEIPLNEVVNDIHSVLVSQKEEDPNQ